jgi:hypothetical protein
MSAKLPLAKVSAEAPSLLSECQAPSLESGRRSSLSLKRAPKLPLLRIIRLGSTERHNSIQVLDESNLLLRDDSGVSSPSGAWRRAGPLAETNSPLLPSEVPMNQLFVLAITVRAEARPIGLAFHLVRAETPTAEKRSHRRALDCIPDDESSRPFGPRVLRKAPAGSHGFLFAIFTEVIMSNAKILPRMRSFLHIGSLWPKPLADHRANGSAS